jgi:transcriptional regulator with XRE-family HTH domain
VTAVDESVTTDRNELNEFIGWHIRSLRLSFGWTHTDLSVQVNRHVATVAGWEAGTRAISVADLVAVAEAFDVAPGSLLPPRGGA